MTALQNRLILHRFICKEFGYESLRAMLEKLHNVPAVFPANGESEYARALYLNPEFALISPDRLYEYDKNIAALSVKLCMTDELGRTWKPYQYIGLLFTEHYLHRYFENTEKLCIDLNKSKSNDQLTSSMPDYKPDDLRTLAFQSATGSGKTLLMHAHILQFKHYLDFYSLSGNTAFRRLNNIILLTPNEQMSEQHECEFRVSGLQARIFSTDAEADLLAPIEIIDLNKLAEKKGVKRVAVQDFGENNLVLVDEGHLGASGKVWRERRKELSRGGFTFEYSATFNQVASKKDPELLNAYGKCMLFDYSYRQFHEDGYGKDYAISNLPSGMEDLNSNMYLLGCLLTFYQQYRIWNEKGAQWSAFNVTKPLWVFLGKTVTAGRSKADKETNSDVVLILNFIGWVLANGETVRVMIEDLLNGHSGLTDEAGTDCFASQFSYLRNNPIDDLYADLCDAIFYGQGNLHVVYLTAGEGEMHLRSADSPVFGVINIGDSTSLYNLLVEKPNSEIVIDRDAGFVERLFTSVDKPDSPINIVVGARRFIAGWNSWRVSTLGLMHVGVREGPEIIQMFGRGIRLKGWKTSLKRHKKSEAKLPSDSADLSKLETLHIFGLRANYMQTFRTLLEREGIHTEREVIELQVSWNFGKKPRLKLIRIKGDRKFEVSAIRPILPNPEDANRPFVVLDLYSRLQSLVSNETPSVLTISRDSVKFEPGHVAFFDSKRIYDRLIARKQQNGWYNLEIKPETVDCLLQDSDWYNLYMPQEKLNVTGVKEIKELEEIATDLVAEYANLFWRTQRRQWESENFEVVTISQDDPNHVEFYNLSVAETESQLITDIRKLVANVQEGYCENLKLGVIMADVHAYHPLLYAGVDCQISVQPVALNKTEKIVVEKIIELSQGGDSFLEGKELYLIRNLTRGRGVSFFDDFDYYPDFIIWLKENNCQHIIFLDPKGLSRFGVRERKKLELHSEIVNIEKQIHLTDPQLYLHSFVISVTPAENVGEETHSKKQWQECGVYFLDDPNCLRQIFEHALSRVSKSH